jgi:5-methyltetrahydropteroyltriglutamate--homocysteine methyltransferase
MITGSIKSATLGFARMGPRRELKMALEKYWRGTIGMDELLNVAREIEELAWDAQAGIDRVSVGDYYLYDGVLSWAEWLGIAPARFNKMEPGIARMFVMARGVDGATALSKAPLICAANVPRSDSHGSFSSQA